MTEALGKSPALCVRCLKRKPRAAFDAHPKSPTGLKSFCRSCDERLKEAWAGMPGHPTTHPAGPAED